MEGDSGLPLPALRSSLQWGGGRQVRCHFSVSLDEMLERLEHSFRILERGGWLHINSFFPWCSFFFIYGTTCEDLYFDWLRHQQAKCISARIPKAQSSSNCSHKICFARLLSNFFYLQKKIVWHLVYLFIKYLKQLTKWHLTKNNCLNKIWSEAFSLKKFKFQMKN